MREKNNNLPETWQSATIGELIGINGVFIDGDWVESKAQDPNGDIRLIQPADIGDEIFRNKSARFLTKNKAYELRCTFLQNGDILIARMPDPLGRACIFPLIGEEKYVTVVDVCIVRLGHKEISSRYLTYAINFPQIRYEIDKYKTGSTRKRISRKNLARANLPVAPHPEQHRIVAKIEQLFSELDKGMAELKKAREKLALYRQSLLKAAFEGRLTEQWRQEHAGELETAKELLTRIKAEREKCFQQQLEEWKQAVKEWPACRDGANGAGREVHGKPGKKPRKPRKPKELPPLTKEELAGLPKLPEGWVWVKLGQLTYLITKGASPKWQGISYVADEQQVFFVTSENVRENRIDLSKAKYVENHFNEKQPNSILWQGDLLFNIVGASIGRTAVFNKNAKANVNQAVSVVRLVYQEMAPYFSAYLNSKIASDLYMRNVVDVARANLSLADVSNISVPLSGIKEIMVIQSIIESHFSNIDHLTQTIDTALQRADLLRQVILKKAFSGKLVPQDSNDLPAPRPGRWFVYALECDDGSIYIGQTQVIEKRWAEHATGKGAEWTKQHPPVKLVHWEEFDSIQAAVKREKELKTGFGRKWLKREYAAGRTRQAGEPASELLKRIQAERETRAPKRRTATGRKRP